MLPAGRAGDDASPTSSRARTAYWNRATPIGYIFAFGAIMGFVVGAIIVYQILFADVSEHLREYATLRAMGYAQRLRLGHRRAAGRHPRPARLPARALLLAHFLYSRRPRATRLPLHLTADRALTVFVLTLAMCALSGVARAAQGAPARPGGGVLMSGARRSSSRNLNHSLRQGRAAQADPVRRQRRNPAGEIVIVTGPSGSGKTTLLTLVGALRSRAGRQRARARRGAARRQRARRSRTCAGRSASSSSSTTCSAR